MTGSCDLRQRHIGQSGQNNGKAQQVQQVPRASEFDMLTWELCQLRAGNILEAGLKSLLGQPAQSPDIVNTANPGVYLICYQDFPVYAGEAKNLNSRVKQQLQSRGTLFKNYENYIRDNGSALPRGLGPQDFSVRTLPVAIGRKELEERAIQKFDLVLNRAMGRRDDFSPSQKAAYDDWNQAQLNVQSVMEDGAKRFFSKPEMPWRAIKPPSSPGLYRVSDETGSLIYVGESSDIKRRYGNHSTLSRGSALRRHIGTELLGLKFERPKTLSKSSEILVDAYLAKCFICVEPLLFGRYEMEEFLIGSLRPLLNRKGK